MDQDKKYKLWDEWKVLVNNKLSHSEFQNLVYDLLQTLKFTNVTERGGGSDNSRDLEGYYTYVTPNKEEYRAKCWMQCKKWKSGIPFNEFSTDIINANNSGVDEYYIISNWELTPSCRDDLEKGKDKWRTRVFDWTGLKFRDILWGNPDICKRYFPDEEVPPITTSNASQDALRLSTGLAERFGFQLDIKLDKKIDPTDKNEIARVVKDALLKINNLDPNTLAFVYEKMSMFFFGLKKTEDALLFLNKSLEKSPHSIVALLNKGYVLEKTNHLNESTKCYDELLSIDPKNVFALNNKASNLRRLGLLKEALDVINSALEVDPDFIIAVYNKSIILKDLKKYDEALDCLNDKKDLLGHSTKLKLAKVDIFISRLDLREAYKLNEEVLANDPTNIDAINNKGVIFERNSKYQKPEKYLPMSMEWFEKAIKNDKNYALGWANKVAILLEFGSLTEADGLISLCYSLFPEDAYILDKKGSILLKSDPPNPKEAIKYFNRAISISAQEKFLLNKAHANLMLRQYNETIKICDSLLGTSVENPNAWGLKGEALKRLHQLTKAKKCFENAEKYKEKPISLLED